MESVVVGTVLLGSLGDVLPVLRVLFSLHARREAVQLQLCAAIEHSAEAVFAPVTARDGPGTAAAVSILDTAAATAF